MDIPVSLRRYWEITVRYAHHLRHMVVSPSFMACARRCAEVTGDLSHFEAAARQAYDGITRPELDEVESARRNHHRQMRDAQLSELEERIFGLGPEGRFHKTRRLSDLESGVNRALLCKAIHDTTDWQYRDPDEVDDADSLTFEVWRLEHSEIKELTRLSMRASPHQAWMDVLDEVRRQVDGTDRYEAPSSPDEVSSSDGQLPPDGSPSEAAAVVLQDAVDDARPEQGASSSQANPSSPEGDLNEMAETLEMIYDEVEGTGDRRYIDAKEAGEILGIKGKTVLNRSNRPEDDDRYIPSLSVAGSNRKQFDREVIERLLEASDR